MARAPGDSRTLSLLDWTPAEEIVRRYDDDRVRAVSLRARISRAVSRR